MAFPGERSRDNARGPGLTGDASTSRALGRRDSFVEAMSRKSTADHSQRIILQVIVTSFHSENS
jgi:hypothetical protein